ncbi:MAG: hypothetical protein N4A47_01780 [Clostridia bacterium]|nr:hypothetical protein [Clostridia bacterium]
MLKEVIDMGAENVVRIPQGKGSYWPSLTDEDWTINFNMSVKDIDKVVRAFGNFETVAYIEGKEIWIREVKTWKENHSHKIGSIVDLNKMIIAAKDGFVKLVDYEIAKEVNDEI